VAHGRGRRRRRRAEGAGPGVARRADSRGRRAVAGGTQSRAARGRGRRTQSRAARGSARRTQSRATTVARAVAPQGHSSVTRGRAAGPPCDLRRMPAPPALAPAAATTTAVATPPRPRHTSGLPRPPRDVRSLELAVRHALAGLPDERDVCSSTSCSPRWPAAPPGRHDRRAPRRRAEPSHDRQRGAARLAAACVPGAPLLGRGPLPPLALQTAGLLAAGPHAVFSHGGAALAYGLKLPGSGPIGGHAAARRPPATPRPGGARRAWCRACGSPTPGACCSTSRRCSRRASSSGSSPRRGCCASCRPAPGRVPAGRPGAPELRAVLDQGRA